MEQARASEALEAAASEPKTPQANTPEPKQENARPSENVRQSGVPTRTKSRMSIFGRSKVEPGPSSNIAPYPGT